MPRSHCKSACFRSVGEHFGWYGQHFGTRTTNRATNEIFCRSQVAKRASFKAQHVKKKTYVLDYCVIQRPSKFLFFVLSKDSLGLSVSVRCTKHLPKPTSNQPHQYEIQHLCFLVPKYVAQDCSFHFRSIRLANGI